MYRIDGTSVWLTRGDTFETTVTIKQADGTTYTPSGSDEVTFGLKRALFTNGGKEFADTTPLISKTIPIATMTLTLLPTDTEKLSFGKYKYDIQLTHNGEVSTFIENADFIITPEVH